MALEHRLTQTQTQRLILSPQIRQYLKLLTLPLLELRTEIRSQLEENPVLEERETETEEAPDPDAAETAEEGDPDRLKEAIDRLANMDAEAPEGNFSSQTSPDDIENQQRKRDYRESIISKRETLSEYLLWQLGVLELSDTQHRIAEQLVYNVNPDGYLDLEDVATTSEQLGVPPASVEEVLQQLQTLDPPGVCARTLQESLLNQLRQLPETTSLAQRIVTECLSELERRHGDDIAKKLHALPQSVKKAVAQISKLEPKPGRIFFAEDPITVAPDASVTYNEETGRYVAEMNEESLPAIRISNEYKRMLKDKKSDVKVREYVRAKIASGVWFLNAIEQRQRTLKRVTEEIVNAQQEFFEHGFSHLKPLRLKDVAACVKLHESTISRATHSKYLFTPQGTIPYKSFFSTRVGSSEIGGEEVSQRMALERLKALVAAENPKKPLSDAKLAELLSTEGVKVARRTVAKYRELSKIAPSYLRKAR